MALFTYAQEIMYLSFALGALLIAGSLTWLLVSVITIARDIRAVVEKAKIAITTLHEVSALAKQKVSDFSIQFKAVSSGVATILDWIDRRAGAHDKNKTSQDS